MFLGARVVHVVEEEEEVGRIKQAMYSYLGKEEKQRSVVYPSSHVWKTFSTKHMRDPHTCRRAGKRTPETTELSINVRSIGAQSGS